jgi:CO dehydrogenase maturation factor
MKVLICGKGGSGKSTLSVMIARALKEKDLDVLLVDADESNFGLHRLMGVASTPDLMESFGGKKGFKEKLNPSFPTDHEVKLFPDRFTLDDIKDKWLVADEGIGLMSIGKIHSFGEGCACPMGVLSKKMFSGLQLGAHEVVIIDTEAGVEHFGRGVIAQGDLLLDIIDPTYESIMLGEKMAMMAESAGIELYYVCNKTDTRVNDVLNEHLRMERVIATVPQDDDIFLAGLEGRILTADLSAIAPIVDLVLKYKTGSPR